MINKSVITKGIVFAGCSFTWGQGLYYYSNLSTLKKQELNNYDPKMVTASQIKYTEMFRFPRIVSNHFETFEWVHPLNGGSHKSIIQWWETCFDLSKDISTTVDSYPVNKISHDEISHIVFQLTQPHRCSLLDLGYENMISFSDAYNPVHRTAFENWLKQNKLNLKSYEYYYIEYSLDTVKKFLMDCENRGLKTLIINWPKKIQKS
jgi:hypothetical protein